jgi:hypothetical protein
MYNGKQGRGEKRVQGFGAKTRRKKPLEKPRRRCEDYIKMEPMEVGCRAWSGFTWLRIKIVGGLL